MIEDLKKSVESEINILREISTFSRRIDDASPAEKKLFSEGIDSLAKEMKSINSSIPEMMGDIIIGELPKTEESRKIEKVETKIEPIKALPKVEKTEEYLKELEISDVLLKKMRRKKTSEKEKFEEFKKARGYLKLSNRIFLATATKLTKKGYFGELPSELKRSNLDILFETYVAMMLFSVLVSFFVALLATIILLIAGFGAIKVIWLPLIVPIGVFLALNYYPTAEKNAISTRINEELPFAVIHMSSISGSGIAPTEIFKIIGLSRDYPFLRKEIRKILNQINIYGFDLVTALNNVSKSTANQKLSELFGGLSTTINSGGSLTDFFQKRADTLLVGYKLEKEKSIKMAETFMDIYISVVIAAPMILMLMLVMISISGIQIGFTPYQLTFATIGGVALINIIFLGYLQIKQT
jgi:Flp pilus assembly protein TadB